MTLADRLDALVAARRSSFDVVEGVDEDLRPAQMRAAAVLVAFVDRPAPTLLLTRRTDDLTHHAGQVAFPGGRQDDGDAGPVATALREAAEEIALPPGAAHVVGLAAPFLTNTGFRIAPVIAVIPPDLPLLPAAGEVAHIFELRADIAFDPAHHRSRIIDGPGRPRLVWDIGGSDQHIWGVTAAIIRSIGEKLGLDVAPTLLNGADV